MTKQSLLACTIAALFPAIPLTAWGAPNDENTDNNAELDTVVVTASRYEQTLDKAAPNVSVISRRTMDSAAAHNLDDLMMYEPGVSVTTDNTRRGNGSINIRGIEGNRILMMVDGIRIPESYGGGNGGGGTITGRDLVETDTLKQVDIVKGPYSALYGSDALGGVVNMSTYSPSDFVDADKPVYFGVKQSYHSSDRSYGTTATIAGHTDVAEGLLMYTNRNGHEYKNRGSLDILGGRRSKNNPQDMHSNNILAKGSIGNEQHRIEMLWERFSRKNDTNVLNAMGSSARGPRVTNTSEYFARDRARRQRLELGYRYIGQGGSLQEAAVQLYHQKLTAEDDAVISESTSMNNNIVSASTRYSDYGFNQTTKGINTRTIWGLNTGGIEHLIVAGAEYKQTNTARPRDSLTVNADGSTTKIYAGSLFPNKTFPDSRRKTFSIYAQDSLTFSNGITLTPALRYEKETLTPQIDQAYLNAEPQELPQKFNDHAFTPSLRLSVPFNQNWTGFASYSRGFRTPPFDSATMSFSNNAFGYRIIPNHNLKSERSDSVELGMKFRHERGNAQITAFYNRYKDFINTRLARIDNSGPRAIQIFQYENLDKVRTHGIEASGQLKLTENWRLNGGIAWMRGKDGDGNSLDTAYPLNGVIGLDYVQDKWGIGSKLRWAKAQKRVSSENRFKTPGYGVWDAAAWYKPNKNIELGLNVYNIGNKKYWQHADMAGRANQDVDIYTQPGRNVAASLRVSF
ncbi:TonB-dependent hemoglobin/transferrin/lactoferrin family receptor [Neisseria montereyensis]|uniref:TonB-dependent hemoglobin/transferrin/lactoferrin family receptor n=1 Tax=Neisseria montereyensis TaxID=2973938 RepID=A0ABT2FA60_9NEIS|nr:TonB-dependent hemoglobin/transferrin/lactoferrin family receptor [Neisseria montereyensis]MCS4533047.1 TonB-dependent hemoglobin/transferrin/lactoferrin family receptor [Neisseria montereyensis]